MPFSIRLLIPPRLLNVFDVFLRTSLLLNEFHVFEAENSQFPSSTPQFRLILLNFHTFGLAKLLFCLMNFMVFLWNPHFYLMNLMFYVELCWFMLIYVVLCWFMLIYVDLLRFGFKLSVRPLRLASIACTQSLLWCLIWVCHWSFLNSEIEFSEFRNGFSSIT